MRGLEAVSPKNLGWIRATLDKNEMDHLWQCIDEKGEDVRDTLVGQISSSYKIEDKNDWFFNNVLVQLGMQYEHTFSNLGIKVPIKSRILSDKQLPYYLSNMWVNYQKQHEFNPVHDHTGIYSFVIWMKIPTDYKNQRENQIANGSNTNVISNFCFNYRTITGGSAQYVYEMSKGIEGTILLFPSQLQHTVYPFYNCEEDRISISGNIAINI